MFLGEIYSLVFQTLVLTADERCEDGWLSRTEMTGGTLLLEEVREVRMGQAITFELDALLNGRKSS